MLQNFKSNMHLKSAGQKISWSKSLFSDCQRQQRRIGTVGSSASRSRSGTTPSTGSLQVGQPPFTRSDMWVVSGMLHLKVYRCDLNHFLLLQRKRQRYVVEVVKESQRRFCNKFLRRTQKSLMCRTHQCPAQLVCQQRIACKLKKNSFWQKLMSNLARKIK